MAPVREGYRSGRMIVQGVLIGTLLGFLFRRPWFGAILGLWIGIAMDASKKKAAAEARRDQASGEEGRSE